MILGRVLSSSSIGDPFHSLWQCLWRSKVPGKVAICVWRACQNLLPTREKLSFKGYIGEMKCLLCPHPLETVGHIMCECPSEKAILGSPPFSINSLVSHSFNFKEWMLEQAVSLSSGKFARLMMFIWSF